MLALKDGSVDADMSQSTRDVENVEVLTGTGDALPELGEEVGASPFTAGHAIGAIGTFGRVIGPGSAADDMR